MEKEFNLGESGQRIGEAFKSINSQINPHRVTIQAMEALNEIGIMITEDSGRVRILSEIMDDLAEKWNGLPNEYKDYVAISILGTEVE